MAQIRNRSDLKTAYEVLREIQTLKPLPGRESSTLDYIHQKKGISGNFSDIRKKILSDRLSLMKESAGILSW